ncbi:hypothetical protein SISNIDRAFT_495582 [Sistotremastrum niveocremeum HHB9708]|uniref:Uncharacterized protein n=1 Tax=Sistotremastrum niveocremeum HHB9708 TaxID=1314777 RepID=A0A164URS9_9AGAM|nr:hypothetical protein SISNIDRAFT_495582 [Sistotremastrum niveocremeum HHB9708]
MQASALRSAHRNSRPPIVQAGVARRAYATAKPETSKERSAELIPAEIENVEAVREEHAAPSNFASLLRRSKFASFDPTVSQVYTSYDGHAHRGDWGLKRPLSLRKKRDSYITVKAVDSHEQQTEWYGAEQKARWIRTIKELGVAPSTSHTSKWLDIMGGTEKFFYDSDFSMRPADGPYGPLAQPNHGPISEHEPWKPTNPARIHKRGFPHIPAMHPKQIKLLAKGLQAKRPDFRKFLKQGHADAKAPNTEPLRYLQSFHQRGVNAVDRFLSAEQQKEYHKPASKAIFPMPHPNAGLSYVALSNVTNKFLYPSLHSRLLGYSSSLDYLAVGVGGLVARLHRVEAGDERPAAKEDMVAHRQPVKIRAKRLTLFNPPDVVTKARSRFSEIETRLDVTTEGDLRSNTSNGKQPGSAEYVSYSNETDGKNDVDIAKPPRKSIVYGRNGSSRPHDDNSNMLVQLRGMIRQAKS